MRKTLLCTLLMALLMLGVPNVNMKEVSAGVWPAIYVDPPVVEGMMPGNSFTVSIKTDYNGTDITSCQFNLSYNPDVLNGVKVTNGDLITQEKSASADFIAGNFDNAAGKLNLTAAFFRFIVEPAPITSGPGTLANVTFTVVGLGASNITLGRAMLIGYTEGGYGDSYYIIDPTWTDHIQHGYFIPEFPTWISLLLTFTILAVSVIILKRRTQRQALTPGPKLSWQNRPHFHRMILASLLSLQ